MDHLKRAEYLLRSSWQNTSGYNRAFFRRMASLWEAFEKIKNYLIGKFNINPVLVGGLTVQHYGFERLTTDIDLLLSAEEYQRLRNAGVAKGKQIRLIPNVRIDVVVGGEYGNPNPEDIRDGNSIYPTFAGLLHTKLVAGRAKDEADIIELLKIRGLTPSLKSTIVPVLPQIHQDKFERLWDKAILEKKQTEEFEKDSD